jgi:hypothetical protein
MKSHENTLMTLLLLLILLILSLEMFYIIDHVRAAAGEPVIERRHFQEGYANE